LPSSFCLAPPILFTCDCLVTTQPSTTSMVATSIVTENYFGNARQHWKAGLLKFSGIFQTCAACGHLPAITSKDSRPRPANVLPSALALILRYLPNASRHFRQTHGRSLI